MTSGHVTTGMAGSQSTAGEFASVQGKVAGLNVKMKTFAVVRGSEHLNVSARNARILFKGRPANIFRLMGSPTVKVQGTRRMGSLISASSVTVLSGTSVLLQPSRYTRMAKPARPAVATERPSRG